MLKNTLMFLLLVVASLFSLVFALIMLYSSPDKAVHPFEASLFIFAGSLGIAAILYNIDLSTEKGYVMKIIYAIYTIIFTITFVTIGIISQNASPSKAVDSLAMNISFVAAIIVIGRIFAIVHSKVGSHE